MSLPTVSFLHSSFHSPCSLPAMSRSRSRTVSSFIRPIGLVSPLPRSYFSQRFFFPSHPSDPPILPVQNFIFTLSRGCSRAVFLKSLFPAQHSNSLSSLSLSLSIGRPGGPPGGVRVFSSPSNDGPSPGPSAR